jgi:hypothetical protein
MSKLVTKNTIRHINVATGKRKYSKVKNEKLQRPVYTDKVKGDVEDNKLERIQHIYKIASHIYKEYPFLNKDKLDKICLLLNTKIIENAVIINDVQYFLNSLIQEFMYLEQVRNKLEEKYKDDIYGLFTAKIIDSPVVIVENKRCFVAIQVKGEIMFADSHNNLYDSDNIFVGFIVGGKPVLLYEIIDLL